MKELLVITSLILWSQALLAQELTALEDSLIALHTEVLGGKSEPERFLANERFLEILDQALALDRKMKHPFDSLETVSHLMPDDKSFRIFSWFVRHQNGEYTYFGVIQRYSEKSGRYESHWLTDMSDKVSKPEVAALDADHWYGAVYYDIIQKGKGGNANYTLLGWDGNDPVMKRRVVEVLTFRQNGSPVFGYPIFRNYQRKARRMIFEHSARASMTLRYDNQGYILKERNPKTRKIKTKEVLEDMIVFDRLVPLEPLLEGQREFYVPESNVFDALVWRNGRWELIKDIDARNPPPVRRKEEPRIPARGLTPR